MKLAFTVFLKFVLPVLVIIAVCVTAYSICIKPIDMLERNILSTSEQRIEDIQNYEQKVYASNLNEVKREKIGFYILGFGIVSSILYLGCQIVALIMKISPKVLLSPEKYEVLSSDEVDTMRYIKDKVMEAGIIKSHETLHKDHIAKLLTYTKRLSLPPMVE